MARIVWTPQRIRALRGERTQAQFAAALGVSRVTVARWETGVHPPHHLAARLLDVERLEAHG